MKRTTAVLLGSVTLATTLLVSGADAREHHEQHVEWQGGMLLETSVHDVEQAIDFYTNTLGFELDAHIPQLKWARFKTPAGVILGTKQVASDEPTGTGTMSLNLTVPDTDEARALLEARGVEFTSETYTIPNIVRLATFTDPWGNRFKLAGPPSEGQPAR
ncbi:MAG: VOC family protein [Phycisphaerales bacterium JB043]